MEDVISYNVKLSFIKIDNNGKKIEKPVFVVYPLQIRVPKVFNTDSTKYFPDINIYMPAGLYENIIADSKITTFINEKTINHAFHTLANRNYVVDENKNSYIKSIVSIFIILHLCDNLPIHSELIKELLSEIDLFTIKLHDNNKNHTSYYYLLVCINRISRDVAPMEKIINSVVELIYRDSQGFKEELPKIIKNIIDAVKAFKVIYSGDKTIDIIDLYQKTTDILTKIRPVDTLTAKIIEVERSKKMAFNKIKQSCLIPLQTLYSYPKYLTMTDDPIQNKAVYKTLTPITENNSTIYNRDWEQKFTKETFSIFQYAPNKKLESDTFKWDNICIAGGFAMQVLLARFNGVKFNSDIDIFIYGSKTERKTAFDRLINWFDTPDTVYAYTGSVVTIYLKNVMRTIQIIFTHFQDLYDVLDLFDFSHIKVAITMPANVYKNGNFNSLAAFMLPCAVETYRTNITELSSTCKITDIRIYKALTYGFHIKKSQQLKEFSNIEEIVKYEEFYNTLAIESAKNFYYSDAIMNCIPTNQQLLYIKSQIFATTKMKNVTTNFVEIINNVSDSFNFISNYTDGNTNDTGAKSVDGITADDFKLNGNIYDGAYLKSQTGYSTVVLSNVEYVAIANNKVCMKFNELDEISKLINVKIPDILTANKIDFVSIKTNIDLSNKNDIRFPISESATKRGYSNFININEFNVMPSMVDTNGLKCNIACGMHVTKNLAKEITVQIIANKIMSYTDEKSRAALIKKREERKNKNDKRSAQSNNGNDIYEDLPERLTPADANKLIMDEIRKDTALENEFVQIDANEDDLIIQDTDCIDNNILDIEDELLKYIKK